MTDKSENGICTESVMKGVQRDGDEEKRERKKCFPNILFANELVVCVCVLS